jgi:hypothetical protein
VLFYEYFHGETGQGLGASHQTGWTALVSRLLEDCAGPAEFDTPAQLQPGQAGDMMKAQPVNP